MLDGLFLDGFAGILLMVSLLSGLIYVVPIFFLGMMMYYFTGDKPGKTIMHNFSNVAFRLYSQFWILVAALVGFYGAQQFLLYLLTELLPNEVDFESMVLVKGLLYGLVAAGLFATHYMLGNKFTTAKQKSGSVMTKMFMGLGAFIFSVIFLVSTLEFVDSLVEFIYDTDMPFGASPLSTWLASGAFWGVYVYNSLVAYRKESLK